MATRPVSDNVRVKAQRLLDEGCVRPRANREEFDVDGDTGTYLVWVPARNIRLRGTCDCTRAKYGGECSHLVACKRLIALEDDADDRALVGLRDGRAVAWFGSLASLVELCGTLGLDAAGVHVHGTVIPAARESGG